MNTTTPAPTTDQDQNATVARRAVIVFARWLPDAGLWSVACSGFALSYSSVQRAALAHVDHPALSYLLPVATDGLALAAAARYVADRRAGLAGARGWQLLAWAAIAASAALNAMGRDLQDTVWHLIGPGALAVITELYAHRAAQLRKEEQGARESIPGRLWATSPRSSFRLWLWTARTGQGSLVEARRAMDRYAAAREALEIACRTRADRRIRNLARDQLRSGVLDPTAVLQVLGWGTGHKPEDATTALRALLATGPGLAVPTGQAPAGLATAVEVHVVDRPADQAGSRPVAPSRVERPAIEPAPAAARRPGRARRSPADIPTAAPRPAGNSKHAVIDEALAAVGTGPQVTAPVVQAWLARKRPEISIGASTIRARLATVRAEAGAEPGAEPGVESASASAEPGAEVGAEVGAESAQPHAEVGAEPARSGVQVSAEGGARSGAESGGGVSAVPAPAGAGALSRLGPQPGEAAAAADVDQAPQAARAAAGTDPQAKPATSPEAVEAEAGRRSLVVVA